MSESESRMDRVERMVEASAVAIDNLTAKVEANAVAIDNLTAKVEANAVAIDNLTAKVEANTASIADLKLAVSAMLDTNEQFQRNFDVLVTENRRIWEYLMNRQPNGGGPGR